MALAHQLTSLYRNSPGSVDAYGVILFTDAHPHVIKVLADGTYWAALSEISGARWAVFSVKPAQGRVEIPPVDSGHLGLLVPIWKEPNDNKELIAEFGLDSTRDLPTLLVFGEDQELHDILQVTVAIDDSATETVYTSLRDSLRRITRVIEGIDPRYRFNAREIHMLIQEEVTRLKRVRILKRALPFLAWAARVFGGACV